MSNQQRYLPYLAQELIDAIIDSLHDDVRALSNCSLVCHSWSHRSTYHLCRCICFPVDELSCLDVLVDSFCRSPRLPATVQSLTLKRVNELSTAIHPTECLRAVLCRLPHLRVLELRGIAFGTIPGQPAFSCAGAERFNGQQPALDVLRISGYNAPECLADVLDLFDSIDTIETRGLCQASLRQMPSCRKVRTTIRSVASFKCAPRGLSAVLKQLRRCQAPETCYSLSMDDCIFSHTYLAAEFSNMLHESGRALRDIHFHITPQLTSVVSQDLPFADLAKCSSLERIGISIQLGSDEKAKKRNIVNFAVMCGSFYSTCERGADSLRNFDISIAFDRPLSAGDASASRSPQPGSLPLDWRRPEPQSPVTGRPTSQDAVIEAFKKLPWTWLNDSLELVEKRRRRLRADCTVRLRVVDATQTSLLEDDRVRSHIQKVLSREAQESLRLD